MIERAAGCPLVVLRDRLLAPLGMDDTGSIADPDRLVPAFVRDDGGLAALKLARPRCGKLLVRVVLRNRGSGPYESS